VKLRTIISFIKVHLTLVALWGLFSAVIVLAGTNVFAQITDNKTVDVTAVVGNIVVPPAPGGGGGGAQSTVVMSGWAFPGAKLTLLKDGAVATSLIANPDGSFRITLNNLNHGNYQLSIFAEDSSGVVSSPHTINVAALSNQPYTFSNIIIPPTISSSHFVVGVNQQYSVFGYAPPNSSVEVLIFGVKSFGTTTANAQGYWQLNLLGEPPFGVYSIRARATLNGFISLLSKPVQILFFLLTPSEPVEPPPPPQLTSCVDYNKDKRINLIDFSILLFWFGKNNPPQAIDCNQDGLINIKDFSILMYFWTG
jgi:hypothetical protein